MRHSQADIGKAQRLLGYAPTHRLAEGIAQAMPWYIGQQRATTEVLPADFLSDRRGPPPEERDRT